MSDFKQYAPIAVFCYNRPDHLKRTIESLMQCPELSSSKVYIFQDGPRRKTEDSPNGHTAVREYIEKLSIGRELVIQTSNSNKGLAVAIKTGIDHVLADNNEIIVLEDDLIVSSGFLKYMNESLRLYRDEPAVMHVSGYMFPIKTDSETFFMNYTTCWGWATWRTAWEKLEWNCLYLYKTLVTKNKWDHFTLRGNNGNKSQLLRNISGELNTWAIRWQASVEINNGYCLHPKKSLVQNIGFDGSGENCPRENKNYEHRKLASKINVKKIRLEENKNILKRMEKFYRKQTQASVIQKFKRNYHVNRLIDFSLRKFIHNVRHETKPIHQLKRIKALERFTPFSIFIDNLSLHAPDNASFISMWSEIFEKEVYRIDPKNEIPLILDIGANIGLSAIYFAREYPNAQICAYEADPEIYKYLEKNISNNNHDNIRAFNSAIWKEDGKAQFVSLGADAGLLDLQSGKSKETPSISIKSLSFRSLLESIDRQIDLLKMDIEGAEVDTILSFPEGLNKIDHVFVEYHSFEQETQKLDELLAALTKVGLRYNIYNVYGEIPNSPFVNKRKYGKMDMQINIFAYRD